MSFMYLRHIVGFSDAASKAIYWKYSIYMFAIMGDNEEPIVKARLPTVSIC